MTNNHALSAYAPARRNSFLLHPVNNQPFSLSSRLSALTLCFTLVVIRCWKDARIWQDVLARLPVQWQVLLKASLQKWQGSTIGFLRAAVGRLLEGLQEQLAPFLHLLAPTINGKKQVVHARTDSGDAPTSILCDGSSTNTWSDYHAYEDRVRQNQALIRKVLGFWFGQYEPDQAQKKLWMIAASSTEQRKQVDCEIADLFTPLLLELASAGGGELSDVHNSTQQQDSNNEAGSNNVLLLQSCRWQQWCADKDIYGYAGKLAAIIVLDQFSRHIRRHQEENQTSQLLPFVNSEGALPPQAQLDALALRTAQLLTESHAQEIHCGMIPVPQYIFGLMPYRHASTLASVHYVQTCVEEAASRNLQIEEMTSRFRKATNRRMAGLQDEARRTGQATTVDDTKAVQTPSDEVDHAEDVLFKQIKLTDEDILETFPFEADMADAADHPVVKAIQSFLADQGLCPIGGSATLKSAPNQKKKKKKNKSKGGKQTQNSKQQKQQEHRKVPPSFVTPQGSNTGETATTPPYSIIVSLSGGVDSMVIASVLAYMKSSGEYPNLNIVAIHIDYANRPESKAESDYVQSYCDKKGIRFVIRRIEEVTRGITARDEYEQRARQMRYDMYRTVAQECAGEQSTSDVGVMLGHHRGDLRENVLSNAHKGCGPLDLSGMTAVSQNDGVTIYRPLLPLEKTDIYDYAHRYGVPYFKDTTPHWSTRGKLRNKLLPLLEEIYGEGSMDNLSTLATESDECRDLLHNTLLKPFVDRVVRTPMGIMFETAPFVAQARGLFFWKFVLREVLHSAGLGMFSDKSVISFLQRIRPEHTQKKTIREGWLQCRRDYAVYLKGDGKVFVFYPASLPWRKSDGYKCTGEVFDVKKQNTVEIGPWTVEAEQCEIEDGEERAHLLKRKAISSMVQFMQGFVEYYLEVPTQRKEKEVFYPAPLVFVPGFRKETRPPAWKNTDEKIQEILPLLGLSEESFQELKHPGSDNPTAVVRVTLDRRFRRNEPNVVINSYSNVL